MTVTYKELPAIPDLMAEYKGAAKNMVPVVGAKRSATKDPSTGFEVKGVTIDIPHLAAYADAGLNAFNVAFQVVADPAFPPVMSVVARSVFDEYYWSDSPFFTVLHDEGVVDTPPETYAEQVRTEF